MNSVKIEALCVEAIRLYQHVPITMSSAPVFTNYLAAAFNLINQKNAEENIAAIVNIRLIAKVLERTNYFDTKLYENFDSLCSEAHHYLKVELNNT
jgi:hypothetical protein